MTAQEIQEDSLWKHARILNVPCGHTFSDTFLTKVITGYEIWYSVGTTNRLFLCKFCNKTLRNVWIIKKKINVLNKNLYSVWEYTTWGLFLGTWRVCLALWHYHFTVMQIKFVNISTFGNT